MFHQLKHKAMTTIYLKNEKYQWVPIEYENIGDIKESLSKNNITIGDRVSIGDGASIGDGVKLPTGFYISGSKHSVTYVGEGKVSIGCHTKEIDWFKENYESLGNTESYSEGEIKEYYGYILLAEMFYKNLK